MIYWFKNYHTGNSVIDRRQREFISKINKFRKTLSGEIFEAEAEVGNIIKYLVNYIQFYLPLEEEFLKKQHEIDVKSHIKEHREFTKKVYQVLSILKSKRSFRPIQLYYLLTEWHENHIHISDISFLKKGVVPEEKILIRSEKEIIKIVEKGLKPIENLFENERINEKLREDQRTFLLRDVYNSVDSLNRRDYFEKSIPILLQQKLISSEEGEQFKDYIRHQS